MFNWAFSTVTPAEVILGQVNPGHVCSKSKQLVTVAAVLSVPSSFYDPNAVPMHSTEALTDELNTLSFC